MVIAVVLNEPEEQASGGLTAAPLFQGIAAPSLHYRKVPGEVPAIAEGGVTVEYCSADGLEGRGQPGRATSIWVGSGGPWRMPDFRSLPFRTALRALEGQPFRIRIEGSGRIAHQDPAPGALLRSRQVLRFAGSKEFQPTSSQEARQER